MSMAVKTGQGEDPTVLYLAPRARL